jgi:hypothetical protein
LENGISLCFLDENSKGIHDKNIIKDAIYKTNPEPKLSTINHQINGVIADTKVITIFKVATFLPNHFSFAASAISK